MLSTQRAEHIFQLSRRVLSSGNLLKLIHRLRDKTEARLNTKKKPEVLSGPKDLWSRNSNGFNLILTTLNIQQDGSSCYKQRILWKKKKMIHITK